MKHRFIAKPLIKLSALALAAMVVLAGCGAAAAPKLVAKVGDTQITQEQFQEEFSRMLKQYNLEDTPENKENIDYLKESLLDMMIDKAVYNKLEEEKNITASQQELDDVTRKVASWKEQNLQYLVESYTQQGKENAEKEANDFFNKYVTDNKLTDEYLHSEFLGEMLYNRLFDELTKDITVTDADVKTQYDKNVESAKKSYDENKAAYDNDKQNGVTVYYIPEGIFYVKHILIGVSEEEKSEISKLRYTENKPEDANAARDKALAKIKEKADAALGRVKAGEDFEKLITELGEDPGMTTSPYKETGYTMYAGNETFVKEFSEASEKLTKDGDVSGLVATDYGYHIIKRVSTQASTVTPLEDVSAELKAQLEKQKKNDAFNAAVEEWKTKNNVEKFAENL